MKKTRIAILGATSHIAKGLISSFCAADSYYLYLFARSHNKISEFMNDIGCNKGCHVDSFKNFDKGNYDVIINCVGIGDPGLLKAAGPYIFELTEKYDNMIIDHLKHNKASIYINMSSGAVYEKEPLSPQYRYYSMAKINSEGKHRLCGDLKIIDLRIYAYFSRFIDLKSKFLITEIINSIRNNRVFKTGGNNVVRDYVGSEDLFSLVCKCIEKGGNDTYDVYSRRAVKKFDILNSFHEKFGLNYEILKNGDVPGFCGIKDIYCSNNKKAQALGYEPEYDSLGLLIKEAEVLLGRKGASRCQRKK